MSATKATTARSSRAMWRTLRLTLLATTTLAVLALTGPDLALASPQLHLASSHAPNTVPAGTYARYTLAVSNPGTSETTSNVSVNFSVPAGLEITSVSSEKVSGLSAWNCSIAGDASSASCVGPEITSEFTLSMPIGPGKEACQAFGGTCHILVTVKAAPEASPGTLHPSTAACGGGVTTCPNIAATAADDPVDIGPLAQFGLTSFDGQVLKANGDPATQAGSHPNTAGTEFFLRTAVASNGLENPIGQLQDTVVKLPPGLVGNPRAYPTCTQAQLIENGQFSECPPESQLGTVTIWLAGGDAAEGPTSTTVPVYDMQRPDGSPSIPIGTPGLFAFNVAGFPVQLYAKLRTGDDYGVTVTAKNAAQTFGIAGVDFNFWGVPALPSHDLDRGAKPVPQPGGSFLTLCADTTSPICSNPSKAPLKPFVTLPTSCKGPVLTSIEVTSWEGSTDTSGFLSHDNGEPPTPIGNEGCSAVDFSPSLEARPTTNVADSPSGLDVDLHIPQNENPKGTAEANLKDTTVILPPGLVVNPSSANGLGGCSEAQFGFTSMEGEVVHTTPDAATCPDAAKLGSIEVDSPLLDHPLKGAAYIANPYQNPFGSLLALYLTIDDPATGVVVKLAGRVTPDPQTGRLTATFNQNPQLPFEDFKLHFFGGSGGSLRTPTLCGAYETNSELTPWTAPEGGSALAADAWEISRSPDGGPCPTAPGSEPNSPALDAGTVSPIAASYSPFVLNLRREDGSQGFSALSFTLPPGLTGKLAGISTCSDAALAAAASRSGRDEQASPSCPASSALGTVTAGAGAGPAPFYAKGVAYLAGPYRGAPLSMAVITPAVAGPFDLGTIPVRVALHVDSSSGQITALSDPIPQILQGIPLDLRSVSVHLDRSQFTRNGTSCNPLALNGTVLSSLGQAASLSNRFQLGECAGLAFKPKLAIRLKGGAKRGAHPALTGILQMPEGAANVASASVALPRSEFLDQAHIGTVCTRVQFAADECPAASVYGHARATSPLVDYAVEGPVYLRSSSHELPDLVLALHGPPSQPIEVDAVARVDSIKGGIRSTFEGVPDLPLREVVLEMEGGAKGLLQNSTNICKGVHKATAELDAQNGKVIHLSPLLKAKCPKAKKHRQKRATRHPRGR